MNGESLPRQTLLAIAVDLFDGNIIERDEAIAFGGFTDQREWSRVARERRQWRKSHHV